MYDTRMKEWDTGKLENLVPDDVETDFRKMFSTSTKLQNKFEGAKQTKPAGVASMMKKKLTDFRPYQPIIRALCNPGLQDRHINDIYKLIGKPRDDGIEMKELSLTTFKQLNILDKKRELEDLSETASKQFSNENTMRKMKEEWKPLEFTCSIPVGKDNLILSGEAVEAIQTVLDDHIIKTQTMKGSPFAKFMLDEISVWENNLMRT